MFAFILIICILYTVHCLVILCNGFKPGYISKTERVIQFIVGVGFAIWGWVIIFG